MPLVKVFRNPLCTVMWYSSAVQGPYFPVALQTFWRGTKKIYISEVTKDRCLPTGNPKSVMARIQLVWKQSVPGKLS
jgi:hypothetical protein